MQIRNWNESCDINVIANHGECTGILHKKPFNMLSVLGTASTNNANAD